jgi:hypothetical protein
MSEETFDTSPRISDKHFYAYLREPPSNLPQHKFENGLPVPYGWSEVTVEVGPSNSLYLHVDADASGEPIGVEVLWADEKLATGWRDNVRVDLGRHEVSLGDAAHIVRTLQPTYENIRGVVSFDKEKKIVRMSFARVLPGDPAYDPDRFGDPEFESFLSNEGH